MWGSRSRDVVSPTCFSSRNVSVDVTFSVIGVQRSDDLNPCSSCVGCQLVIDVSILGDTIMSAKV